MTFIRRTRSLCTVASVVFAVTYTMAPAPAHANTPVCSSAASDLDGDGWGWENFQSCTVPVSTAAATDGGSQSSSGRPVCVSRDSDPDNDGFGWENNQTCEVTSATGSGSSSSSSSNSNSGNNNAGNTTVNGVAVCQSNASDTDNDGWGFENGRSCRVTAQTSTTQATATSTAVAGVAPPPVAAATPGFADGHPICLTDASDAGNNGFGYENNRTCRVVNGVTATRNQPLLNQRSCIDWLEIGYGNYRLQNNVWNAGAVFSDNWSQCIELTGSPGNYVAQWDYNWLPRTGGNEFAVKSYPQVYYGRKTQYNSSGTVAQTGLPVETNRMPQYWVDFNYSETGIVERNVALESFFHTSCEAEEHNKQYEMMVWVGVPAIRTPGTLATTVNLDGREWDVYTNPALPWAYVAFVARQPFTSGRLDWNAFVDWSRFVGPSFGVPAMANFTCMGAIEMGTETFWGTGTFSLNRFRVSRGS